MKRLSLLLLFSGIAVVGFSLSSAASPAPSNNLRVVIIRHGEKAETGHNLSCKGENRALLLPAVLHRKFKVPDHLYVTSTGVGKSNAHYRMLETIIPFAVKYDVKINTEFDVSAFAALAGDVLQKHGTVLIVWEHVGIPALAAQLGVTNPPNWRGKDFDSIWVITFVDGKASLSIDAEGIVPPTECNF